MKSEIVLETEAMIEGQLCESGDVIATIDSPFEFSTVAGLVSVFRAKRVIVDAVESDEETDEPADEELAAIDDDEVATLGVVEPVEPVTEIDHSGLIEAGLSEKLAARLVRNGIHTVDEALTRYNELEGDLSKLDGIGAGYAKQIADILFVDEDGDDEPVDEPEDSDEPVDEPEDSDEPVDE